MIPVAITYCSSLSALRVKLKKLYDEGKYNNIIFKKLNDQGSPIGRYNIAGILRMPTRKSVGNIESFGLIKCSPYDEDGNLIGIMKDLYPEVKILQYGINRSASNSPWNKQTQEQRELLHSIEPVYIKDADGEDTVDPDYNHIYGECSTRVSE